MWYTLSEIIVSVFAVYGFYRLLLDLIFPEKNKSEKEQDVKRKR